ncbi:MAG: hypothetical protein L0Y67_00065 [Gammaproteobacteria bacterium]|nr:hypothetical protein [Gammaproteobacteria bacterium]
MEESVMETRKRLEKTLSQQDWSGEYWIGETRIFLEEDPSWTRQIIDP